MNLYGDIPPDLGAEMTGSLAPATSATSGTGEACFESVCGPASQIAGQGKTLKGAKLGREHRAVSVDAPQRGLVSSGDGRVRALSGGSDTTRYLRRWVV
jgi:hypothetical protein